MFGSSDGAKVTEESLDLQYAILPQAGLMVFFTLHGIEARSLKSGSIIWQITREHCSNQCQHLSFPLSIFGATMNCGSIARK